MSIDIQEELHGAKLQVRLGGELDIYAAATMREYLNTAMAKHHEIELNLEDVSDLDGAGLQILIAAKAEALRLGAQFNLTSHSVAVLKTLQTCRLSSFFGDPIVLTREMAG